MKTILFWSLSLTFCLNASAEYLGQTVDKGDYYVLQDGSKVKLLQAVEQIAVSFKDNIPVAESATKVKQVNNGSPVQLIESTFSPGKSRIDILKVADSETTRKALAETRDLQWATPLLINPQTKSRVIPTRELVVALSEKANPDATLKSLQNAGLVLLEQLPGERMYLFKMTDSQSDAFVTTRTVSTLDGVLFAQPNFTYEIHFDDIPNDPWFSKQQSFKNSGQNGATVGADANISKAWDITQGTPSIAIAVIDTGVDSTHPDLVVGNPGEIGGGKETNGIDDDGNGKIDDWRGWNFYSNNNNTSDDEGHGTACAGIAAAKGNNSTGISGVARNCRILPVKIASGGSFTSSSTIGSALAYAYANADILSCSFGGGTPDMVFMAYLKGAWENGRNGKGCPVFFSSGNSASEWGWGGSRLRIKALPSGYSAGNYFIGFFYQKDASGVDGEDLVKLDNVEIIGSDGYTVNVNALGPNGRQDFEGSFPPSLWALGAASASYWTTTSVNPYKGSAGIKSAVSGATSNNGATLIRTPSISLSTNDTLACNLYISTQTTDQLLLSYYNASGTYLGTFGTTPPLSGTHAISTAMFFPAGYSTMTNYLISVGASTDADMRADYSQYGPTLDIVAPSNGGFNDVVSLDIVGSGGRSADEINRNFGGTSAACPLAAGIAGLMLTSTPDLTSRQVRKVMHFSCEKIGGVSYTAGEAGAGGRNDEYGYGRINAAKAVTRAKNVQIAASEDSSYAVKLDGSSSWGWGDNSAGQLGNGGTVSPITTPTISLPTSIVEISSGGSGSNSAIALQYNGSNSSVWTWGENGDGQLGSGDTISRSSPFNVTFGTSDVPTAVASGGHHCLSILSGNVWGWGENNNGQVGIGNVTSPQTTPAQVKIDAITPLSKVIKITCGNSHSLAIVDGQIGAVTYDRAVFAWGANPTGGLGDGTTTQATYAKFINLSGVQTIAAGNGHSLAIKSGKIYSWGNNSNGQLGIGSTTAQSTPTQITSPSLSISNIVTVAAGGNHSLAIATVFIPGSGSYDRAVISWGLNNAGQLGDGTITQSTVPTVVKTSSTGYLSDIVSIRAGDNFSIAMDSTGKIYTWGSNSAGQLGYGYSDGIAHSYATAMPSQPLP
jgi:alpha-tubulin suppressor-like RCC1 family protein